MKIFYLILKIGELFNFQKINIYEKKFFHGQHFYY
jgi:hypothetical protein